MKIAVYNKVITLKKILLSLMVLATLNANAQTPDPRIPNRAPKSSGLPVPKVLPTNNIKPDLIVSINGIEKVVFVPATGDYFVYINFTVTNNADAAITASTTRRKPIVASYVEFEKGSTTEFRSHFSVPTRLFPPHETHTVTESFKVKGLSKTKITTYNVKLLIDDEKLITEANEDNNESQIVTFTADPSIIE